MFRPQDVLFVLFGLLVGTLLAFHFGVAVLALVGAFLCGGLYLLTGMIPSRDEPFLWRTFTSGFLAIVLSSIVLIVPGTMGAQARQPEVEKTVAIIAGLLPLIAIGFEVIRTPRIIRGILRYFGYR